MRCNSRFAGSTSARPSCCGRSDSFEYPCVDSAAGQHMLPPGRSTLVYGLSPRLAGPGGTRACRGVACTPCTDRPHHQAMPSRAPSARSRTSSRGFWITSWSSHWSSHPLTCSWSGASAADLPAARLPDAVQALYLQGRLYSKGEARASQLLLLHPRFPAESKRQRLVCGVLYCAKPQRQASAAARPGAQNVQRTG